MVVCCWLLVVFCFLRRMNQNNKKIPPSGFKMKKKG